MPKTLLKKIIIVVITIVVVTGSLLALCLKHRDTLRYSVPATTSVYLHLEQADKLLHLSPAYQSLLNNLIKLEDRNFNLFGVAETIGRDELAIFKTKGHPFILAARESQALHEYLKRSNVNYFGKKVLYFPTNRTTVPELGLTAKRQIFNFSDINLYFSGDEPLIFGNINTANIKTPPISARINIDAQTGILKTKTNVKTNKDGLESLIMKNGLPKDTEIYLTNADLFEAPLTANLIKDHFDYILLQKASKPLEYLKTPRGSLFNFGSNYSKDQIIDMVRFTLATINPKETEHSLPDGTKATNLILDPTLWSFTKTSTESEIYQLNNYISDITLYLEQYNDSWVLTSGLDIKSLMSEWHETIADDGWSLDSKVRSTIMIAPYQAPLRVDFYPGNFNLMNVCLH